MEKLPGCCLFEDEALGSNFNLSAQSSDVQLFDGTQRSAEPAGLMEM